LRTESLKGKTAVVTGAAGTMGRAVVLMLRDEGLNVVGLDVKGDCVHCDVSDPQAVKQAIAKAGETGKDANEEQIELHRKFSIPFACVVFTLVGVPLSIPPSRAVRSRGFSMSLALIFLYYIPLTVGQTLADKGIVPAVVGLWIPNAAFFALGTFLFRAAAREEPIWFFEQLEFAATRAIAFSHELLRKLGGT